MTIAELPGSLTREVGVIAVDRGTVREDWAEVCEETMVQVFVNDVPFVRLALTNDHIEEFIHGFLVCEGVVMSPDAVDEVRVASDGIRVRVNGDALRHPGLELRTSGCPGIASGIDACRSPLPAGPAVEVCQLLRAAGLINEHARLWKRTGGTHCTVIAHTSGEVIAAAEDMGRHTSVDKAVGSALLGGADLSSALLVCTGRLPSGMVVKAYRAGIPIVVSNTAPMLAGIELAERLNMTLVGFARPPRLTVYSHPERVMADGVDLVSVARGKTGSRALV